MSDRIRANRARMRVEAETLVRHVADFLDSHGLLVPELVVVTPKGVEARLSLKRLPPSKVAEEFSR